MKVINFITFMIETSFNMWPYSENRFANWHLFITDSSQCETDVLPTKLIQRHSTTINQMMSSAGSIFGF